MWVHDRLLLVSSPTLSSVPPPSSDLEATLGECIARQLISRPSPARNVFPRLFARPYQWKTIHLC
ncbi:hypothetical protein M404DRAFT_1006757 [Pisolithus tinctorius Marx 270]|uniref:Uncharacterized protein n=1 Tax=Pisolithus tinctorius Marx 270 TaxID=870435 RepID=A0A0C3N5Y4_PISTI|nr:hypothetical protein M404DRAFT_1006757 [Pisolithus tinctorius Marx 270]